jgi:ATP-dependent Clp protease ATP-binding subunit ClpA
MAAQSLAGERTNAEMTPEHLCSRWIEQQGRHRAVAAPEAERGPGDRRHARSASSSTACPRSVAATCSRRRASARARRRAGRGHRLQDDFISTEHLFIALATEAGRSPGAQLLQRWASTKDALYARSRRCAAASG